MLKRTRTVVLVLAVAPWLASCDDPVAALVGVTAVSTGPLPAGSTVAHSHRCTVPATDLQDPPAGNTTYTTTGDQGHSHHVTLSQSDLVTLNEPNGAVDVVTSDRIGEGPSHTHIFHFTH